MASFAASCDSYKANSGWPQARSPSNNVGMLRPLGRLALAACALLLPCCGAPDVETPIGVELAGSPAVGGGAGAPPQVAAGTGGASAGSNVGGSAGQSAAGSSAGGAVACTSYADAAGYTLPVHIKNSSTATLYLGPQESTCEVARLFAVEDGARHVLPSLDGCHTSCSALMQTGPVACPLACATPSTVTLAPGQSVDVPWDGRFAVPQTLPQQCMPSASTGSGSCVQAQQVQAAPFTFKALAGTKRQCLDPSGTCTCTPNANGTCTSPSSVIAGTIITTELFLKLEPGEKSPGGEPQYIGLEFKDAAN
jgi:hypothetical protein